MALIIAAKNGNINEVKRLLDNGAPANARDDENTTPLQWAAFNNHADVVRLLLDKKEVDVNIKNSHNLTPLHFAAHSNYPEVAKVLLEKGAMLMLKMNITKRHYGWPLCEFVKK